jgi:AcrR family transcriptional regulator
MLQDMNTAPDTAEGIRARTRRELVAAIKAAAHRQLATSGAAGLSLRAIARDLHMASSALYRYFASRDDLLTALVIDAYNDLGEAAETALARHAKQPPLARWVAVCRSARRWALAHPHAYALIYGTPVPGYHAPANTVAPASRVGLALAAVVADAGRSGLLGAPTRTVPESLGRDADRLAAELGLDLPREVVAGLVAAWSQLFGLVSFELFGQFENMISARGQFFDRAVERLAESIGFAVPAP